MLLCVALSNCHDTFRPSECLIKSIRHTLCALADPLLSAGVIILLLSLTVGGIVFGFIAGVLYLLKKIPRATDDAKKLIGGGSGHKLGMWDAVALGIQYPDEAGRLIQNVMGALNGQMGKRR